MTSFDVPKIINLPKRKTFLQTSWCRMSLIDRKTYPHFRLHFALAERFRPSLWVKIGRLDLAFHRYV